MSIDDLFREDAENRRRALDPVSFIVEAPAGAGKTELLTQRVLRLLAIVDAPEEVVAITFTNKAAAEMKSRIVTNLARAAAGEPPSETHRRVTFDLARDALAASVRHGWNLMENPGRLRITTIDAFCAGLARQMPFLSRFGAQPRLADKPKRHYEEAARRTLVLVEADDATGMAVADALRHLDNDVGRLAKLLAAMLARRDQWLPHILGQRLRQEAEAALAALIGRDLANAAATLDTRSQSVLMPLADFAAANVDAPSPLAALRDWKMPLAGVPEEMPRWRALCELLLTKDGSARRQINKKQGFPPGKEFAAPKAAMSEFLASLPPAAATALARIRELPDPRYREDDWHVVAALSRLLQLAAAQLWTVFNEAGEADFVEVAQRALLALGRPEAPTDLALSLDYRIRHLLVDEFQDTSPTQVELLRRLTAGWVPGDGRTLFAVGDPMQSIYRFRKADVGLFLRVAEEGIGGLPLERLRLTRNNRSCAAVVDWVNRNFAGIFPSRDGVAAGAIRYREFVPTREPLSGMGVFVHPLIDRGTAREETADVAEARRIIDIVRKVRRDDPGRRIAVLVRARSHLDALVAAMRRHHGELPFQAVEIEGLASRQPVQDLLSLVRALSHRADRVHWLATLRAPWCGLTLADLHALAGDNHRATLWQLMHEDERLPRLSADGGSRLAHLRGVFAQAFAHRGRQRLRRWIEGVWLRLGGAACLAGGTDVADVRAFFDLIDRLDAGGRFSIEELEREMADLYAAPDPEAGDGLQFMTIHKAKGLEFDTVIVPGLHRVTGNGELPLMLWEEVLVDGGDESLIAAPMNQRGADNREPSVYDYLRRLEAERGANENARVLYVAATRAIRALHLVGVVEPKTDGTLAAKAGSFLQRLWDALGGDFNGAAAQGGEPVATGDESPADFQPRLVRLARPTAPAILLQEAPHPPWVPKAQVASEALAGNAFAADVGTLVHAYLELIARDGPGDWTVQRVDALRSVMAGWLRQQGHTDADAGTGADQCVAALLATLESREGQWVLAPRADAAAELALASHDGARIATQVVDRCFVEAGVRWIVDYKTARIEGGEALLRAHAERYRPQLEGYGALFASEGLPVRMAIFYAASGRLVRLD